MSEKVMQVYERIYDNPVDIDGNQKPNKFLGEFTITQTIFEDFYSGKWIGVKDDKTYLIEQHEVSGFRVPGRGGSRFTVHEIQGANQ